MKPAYNDLRALYRAARREEEPKRADRRAVRAALLGAGAASVAVHASAAGAKFAAAIPGAAKLFTAGQLVSLIGVGVALGSGVAVIGAIASPKPAAPAFSVSVTKQPAARYNPKLPEVTRPAPESNPESSATADVAAPAPLPSSLRAQPGFPQAINPQAATSNPQTATLVAESRGLAEVQSALSAQDPARALQLLSAQDHAFRAGSLGQERAAARVIALCAAGRIAEATAAREQFLIAYPTSPLAKRVSGVCAK